jgi:hypothetical protein
MINSLDLLYFVLAIAAVWIGALLAWLLFEAALMAHRANYAVKEAIEKVKGVERAILNIKDRLESSAGYLGALAEGGKVLMSYMGRKKSSRKRKQEEDEEEV